MAALPILQMCVHHRVYIKQHEKVLHSLVTHLDCVITFLDILRVVLSRHVQTPSDTLSCKTNNVMIWGM
jgi:hypothetical protein